MIVKKYSIDIVKQLKDLNFHQLLWTCFAIDALHCLIIPFLLKRIILVPKFTEYFIDLLGLATNEAPIKLISQLPHLAISSAFIFFLSMALLNSIMYYIAGKKKLSAIRYHQSYQLYLILIFTSLAILGLLMINLWLLPCLIFAAIHILVLRKSMNFKTEG